MPDQKTLRNRLLSLLSPEDFQSLAPQLELVKLPKGHVLVEPGQPISDVYFLESGVGF